jgi:hypothetical protein
LFSNSMIWDFSQFLPRAQLVLPSTSRRLQPNSQEYWHQQAPSQWLPGSRAQT